MAPTDFSTAANPLLPRRETARQLMTLRGSRGAVVSAATEMAARFPSAQRLWCAANAPTGSDPDAENVPSLTPQQARHKLGSETDLLIFDAIEQLDVNALAALTGTLRGGGLLLLLLPPDEADSWCKTRFGRRFEQSLERCATALHWLEGQPLPTKESVLPMAAFGDDVMETVTADQQTALDAIARVAHGHRHRPLVLTADRGRGKTSALGLAAADLLRHWASHEPQVERHILITAPRPQAVAEAFRHASKALGKHADGNLSYGRGTLRFVAPDALAEQLPPADLLLVDEAAALPVPLLETCLRHYPRLLYSTTTHGYEGTGRGFALRFRHHLDAITPQWRALALTQPVRWPPGDALEQWLYDALLLDAQAASDEAIEARTGGDDEPVCLDRDQLQHDEAGLRELFGLLVQAHYQTTPADLQRLLDAPDTQVWTVRRRGHVIAAALVVDEGELVPELAEAVARGERRLRGQLIPQLLAAQLGESGFATLRGRRILRIAVHPAAQRSGIGSRLLQAVIAAARAESCAWIGSSFGVTAELLAFWGSQGLVPVHLGARRDASSGEWSVLVMAALTQYTSQQLQDMRAYGRESFSDALPDRYRAMSTATVLALLRGFAEEEPAELEDRHWQQLRAYASAARQYEACELSLRRFALLALSSSQMVLDARQLGLLIGKLLQRYSWAEICRAQGFAGRAQAEEQLRTVFALLQAAA